MNTKSPGYPAPIIFISPVPRGKHYPELGIYYCCAFLYTLATYDYSPLNNVYQRFPSFKVFIPLTFCILIQ